MYANGEFRDVLFYRQDVEANLERRYQPGEIDHGSRTGDMAPTNQVTVDHFLQIPGPTNVPERVSLAMARAVVDHRGAGLSLN